MKTLEIKTESGTYLVLELPEGATEVRITMNWIHYIHNIREYEDHFVGTPENKRIPSGNWQLIGFGKDHPKLLEEIGLLQENSINAFKPTCTCDACIIERNRMDEAEKRVFKNPAILRKND